jgi:hypothetical protein
MNYLMFKAVLQSMQYERSKNQEAMPPFFSQEQVSKGY